MKHFDIVIIGGGPAGLTAGIYAARRGVSVLIITKTIGGRCAEATTIENYPGFHKINGFKLAKKMEKHAKKSGVRILYEEVVNINKNGEFEILTSTNKRFFCKALVIATGAISKRLDVKGESEFKGRGLSYCVVCDGPLYKDKIVAVVGNKNEALQATLYLADIAKKVILIFEQDKIDGEESLLKRVKEKKNIEIMDKTKIKEIIGDEIVDGIIIERNGKEEKIELQGIFVEIGTIPLTELTSKLGIEMVGNFIKVNEKQETNVNGIFACGDVTSRSALKQVVIACAEGAIAGNYAANYVKNLGSKD
ncbi:MAG: FAD-dependent oxidoreductase [Candidatus Parvarchaeota archaeon]|nr:FAD-dependent oxidoreductase [Candidatus Jingweiarchaeum tengchongense]MCW1298635.1 FAD-dependent oxidoreductase [Candidatus Jingweiarchaeum tengchongense]MCW1300477.1 FAD-dependent oxidoreductase [Candidatus Jingweiarchaeum tengchongense]MCW1304708.1 FAD-dependent oxidoreductase [Candidatus Jingweiarchaeum tengchongense]MCW1306213.1 FAD-dependent oxidoreductase [Candidatus Jingweiarchaeum tengchongense]